MSLSNCDPIEHSVVGLKAFLRISAKWGLNESGAASLLGLDHAPTAIDIDLDRLERISHTLAIFRALNTLLPEDAANGWVHRQNTASPFEGRTALDLMKEGTEGFRTVRAYLSAELGG